MNRATAAAKAQSFEDAWRSLQADPSVQFGLTAPKPPTKPPAWLETFGRFIQDLLRPIGHFIAWLFSFLPDAAYARIILGVLLAAAAALLVWLIVRRIQDGAWHWPWRARDTIVGAAEAAELEWQPKAAPARAWLEEADALACDGRFAEAIHCLFLRSVEELARWRPRAVRPALTARELALSPLLPERSRAAFSSLASGVERSLFGARAIDEPTWLQARSAYSEFALTGTWTT